MTRNTRFMILPDRIEEWENASTSTFLNLYAFGRCEGFCDSIG